MYVTCWSTYIKTIQNLYAFNNVGDELNQIVYVSQTQNENETKTTLVLVSTLVGNVQSKRRYISQDKSQFNEH